METSLKVPAKIIMYRMFALIDTRSACIPFRSPLPQKGSSVAISSLPLFFFFLPSSLLIFAAEVSKKKWILQVWRSFHLAVSGGIVKADCVYRPLGVAAFRNLHLLVPSSPW